MSRSNPTDGVRNPSTRWFEWAGGSDGGFMRWYDKEAEKQVKAELPFSFLLLDELATVKGWHEASESGIYANEVRDTRQDVLVVRSFKGGELVSGLYAGIRDSIVAKGGHYNASLYIAYKEGGELRIGNISLKGAAASAWMEFKRNAPTKKDANGKSLKAFYVDAVKVIGYEDAKKGGTAYRVPKFALTPTTDATNQQAVALDAELQAFLTDYLKRPKAEASTSDASQEKSEPAPKGDSFESDIPWRDEVEEPIPF